MVLEAATEDQVKAGTVVVKSDVDTTRVSAFSKATTATMSNSCSLWYWKLLLRIRLKLRVTCHRS